MKYLHLTTGPDGVSRFSDGEIALTDQGFAPPAPVMPVSDGLPATNLLFLVLPVGWGGPQHPSPRRQVAFCLSGMLDVTAGTGETRRITQGGIWRMEDTTGPGHTTQVIGDEDVRLAIVQLE